MIHLTHVHLRRMDRISIKMGAEAEVLKNNQHFLLRHIISRNLPVIFPIAWVVNMYSSEQLYPGYTVNFNEAFRMAWAQ